MKWKAMGCMLVTWLPAVVAADVFRSDLEPDLVVPDNNSAGVSTSLQANPACTITDVNIAIEMAHSWVGDLIFKVIHDGVTVAIVDRPGIPPSTQGCSSDLDCGQQRQIVLDDEVTTEIETFCPLPDIVGGTYKPNEVLAAFDGHDQSGTWTLFVADNQLEDAGTLCAWEVRTTCQANAVEPATWGAIKTRYSD
jgi:hypothetical protein